MHPPIASVIPPEGWGPWLALIAMGAYHGLNPGMGWLFALSRGLQHRSERALWLSLIPIAGGHAASVGMVGAILLAMQEITPIKWLRLATAVILLGFGLWKLFNYYRHPKWVGMRVGMKDLFAWSFLMATAHGAGLMAAPALISATESEVAIGASMSGAVHRAMMDDAISTLVGVGMHTLAMLVVMGLVAWVVYRKLGLRVLKESWINFDLIWAAALIVVGVISLLMAIFGGGHDHADHAHHAMATILKPEVPV